MKKLSELSYAFDKYLDMVPADAYNRYRDERNIVVLRRFVNVVGAVFGLVFLISALEHGIFQASTLCYLVVFLSALVFRIIYKQTINLENIRRYLFMVLVILFVSRTSIDIVKLYTLPQSDDENKTEKVEKQKIESGIVINADQVETKKNVTSLVFFFCLSILFFKLSRNEIIQLFTIAFGIPILTELLVYNNFSVWDKIISLFIALSFFVIAYSAETKRKKKFIALLGTYTKRHLETYRMKKELGYAREIQLSMLPPGEAKFGDLEIAATSVPTFEVGGDYFDYFKISDNLIGVFICDVSGHGVASALLLSGLRSCMHLILEETNNPKEVFIKLNRMIRKTQNKKMFVTAIFALMDLEKNTCSLFNAGHLPPYKISGDSFELFKIKRHGITLGAVDDISLDMGDTEVVFEFKKNDKLILYTDGVSEAMNSKKTEYGFEKLEMFLNSNADKSPSDLLNLLIADVNSFTKDVEQKDDMSVMIIGRKDLVDNT